MKNKYLIIILIFLITGAAFYIVIHTHRGVTTLPPPVPPEHQQYYDEAKAYLDRQTALLEPCHFEPMTYGVMQSLASYNRIEGVSADDINTFTDGITETGADLVKLYMPVEYWTTSSSQHDKYDDVINYIRAKNKTLMIAFRPAKGISPDRQSFADFKSGQIAFMNAVIPRYKPDYYAFVVEPETMNKEFLASPAAYEEWVSMVEEFCPIAKQLHPAVKAATISTQQELDFAKNVSKIPCLDIVGINLYGMIREEDMQPLTDTYAYVQSQGKGAWITETWIDWKDTNKPWREELDAEYITYGVYIAQRYELKGYIVDYPRLFFTYEPDITATMDAIKEGTRLKSYYTYKNIISQPTPLQ